MPSSTPLTPLPPLPMDQNSETQRPRKSRFRQQPRKTWRQNPIIRLILAIFGMITGVVRFILAAILLFILVGLISYWTVTEYVGRTEIFAPDITGLSLIEALKVLRGDSLMLQLDDEQFNESVPRHHVISQFPAKGSRIKPGSPIRIVISGGAPLVLVPDLKRRTLAQATALLQNKGLTVGTITYAPPDPNMPPGQVLKSDPPTDAGVELGFAVNLLISPTDKKPKAMPYVIGLSIAAARDALSQLDLIATEQKIFSDTALAGLVYKQTPAAGEAVDETTPITLTYSPDRAQTVAPEIPEFTMED